MIDAEARPMASLERWEKARLAPVLCPLCNHPVAHFDPRVVGALAGGMCLRSTCIRNPKTGKPREVYVFNRVVADA